MALDIRALYGPILLGVFLNMILYGVLVMQTYIYYLKYKQDKIWIKLIVLYLLIVESVNIACNMHIIYESLVQHFNNPEAIEYFPTAFAAEPICIVAASTPIQLFLAWRVWIFTKSKIVPVVIALFVLVSLVGGIWTAYGIDHVKLLSRVEELHTSALVWLLTACAADVLITVVLVFSLNKMRTGFVATDDVLSKLIRMTIQTGLLTTVFALADVVCFLTLPRTGANFVFDFPLSKLYTNCLLSTLNARVALQTSISTADHSGRHNQVTSRRNDGAFEMSPMKYAFPDNQHAYDPGDDKYPGQTQDIECAVKVTKVVEMRDDDIPASSHTQ